LNFICAGRRRKFGFYLLDFFGFLFMAVIPPIYFHYMGCGDKVVPRADCAAGKAGQIWRSVLFYGGMVADISFWSIEGEKNGE
jgi:hypothetical protein